MYSHIYAAKQVYGVAVVKLTTKYVERKRNENIAQQTCHHRAPADSSLPPSAEQIIDGQGRSPLPPV